LIIEPVDSDFRRRGGQAQMARTVPIEKPEDSVAVEYTRVLRIFSEGVKPNRIRGANG
jgi:Xaa-Pro aminopeptidase